MSGLFRICPRWLPTTMGGAAMPPFSRGERIHPDLPGRKLTSRREAGLKSTTTASEEVSMECMRRIALTAAAGMALALGAGTASAQEPTTTPPTTTPPATTPPPEPKAEYKQLSNETT